MLSHYLVFASIFLIVGQTKASTTKSAWICTDEERLDRIVGSEIVDTIDCQMYNSDGCVANSTTCTCWPGFTGRKCDLLYERRPTSAHMKLNTWLLFVLVNILLVVLMNVIWHLGFKDGEVDCCCGAASVASSILVFFMIYNIFKYVDVINEGVFEHW